MWEGAAEIPEFNVLPGKLRLRLALTLNKDLFQKVPLFQKMKIDDFVQLVQRLRPLTFLPGEFVVKSGEEAIGIYFVQRGRVDLLVANNDDASKKKGKGSLDKVESEEDRKRQVWCVCVGGSAASITPLYNSTAL